MMTSEELISTCSAGHRNALLFVALSKRLLSMFGTKVNEQLRMLEQINSCACHEISPAMIELVEPATDTELQMIDAAMSLDAGDAKLNPSFDVLAKSFRQFCKINPSYIAALRLGAPKAGNSPDAGNVVALNQHKSSVVRYSEPAAAPIPPKQFPKPPSPPEKYSKIAGPMPWDHVDG
jgi:hypothetical protein